MGGSDSTKRLDEAAATARAAEALGEDNAAGEAWRRYRLIRDAARDPDELLAEGIALSLSAIELARPSFHQL
jgi:negative regulator of sigma E activity